MPIPMEYRDICSMLLEATRLGRVAWTEKDGTFIVRLPEYNLEVWGGVDEHDNKFVAVGLKDPKGRRFFDSWYVEENDEDLVMLQELLATIRRHVRQIPRKLDALRSMLQQNSKIGMDIDSEES